MGVEKQVADRGSGLRRLRGLRCWRNGLRRIAQQREVVRLSKNGLDRGIEYLLRGHPADGLVVVGRREQLDALAVALK